MILSAKNIQIDPCKVTEVIFYLSSLNSSSQINRSFIPRFGLPELYIPNNVKHTENQLFCGYKTHLLKSVMRKIPFYYKVTWPRLILCIFLIELAYLPDHFRPS